MMDVHPAISVSVIPLASQMVELNQSFIFLSVSAFLMTVAFALPTILIVLDKRDWKLIRHQIDNREKFELALALSRSSNKPLRYWLFK